HESFREATSYPNFAEWHLLAKNLLSEQLHVEVLSVSGKHQQAEVGRISSLAFLFYDLRRIVHMLFPIYDFDALRLDAISSRTLIHVMQSRIGGLFLRFDFNPPLPVLHLIQPKGIHSRSPRFPFLFEATVSCCVLVAVFLN